MGFDYLKKRKKELHMTNEELSTKSGVPIGTINKLLAGQTADPKFETLKAICKALEISLAELEDYENINAPLTAVESELITTFRELNEEGQEKLIEYAQMLKNFGYIKSNQPAMVEEA